MQWLLDGVLFLEPVLSDKHVMLFVCVSVCLCFCLYVFLFVCVSVCLCFCLYEFLFVCISVCLCFCFYVFLFECVLLCLSVVLIMCVFLFILWDIMYFNCTGYKCFFKSSRIHFYTIYVFVSDAHVSVRQINFP